MAKRRLKLGEILKQWGKIDEPKLQEALKLQQNVRKPIGELLVELGYVPDTVITQALASQYEMEYIDIDMPDAVKKENIVNESMMPKELMTRYFILPLSKENGKLKVLINNPLDLELLDLLRFRMNTQISTALGNRRQIKEYLERAFNNTSQQVADTITAITTDKSIDITTKTQDLDSSMDEKADDEANQAPVVRLVNHIIYQAVQARASDIHIEPFADRVRLRYRIDGVCHEQDKIPKRTQAAIIARLKIMAGVKIEEKRIPQDGRIKMRIDDRMVDFRFSCCPYYHGEGIVMRILRPDAVRLGLENLGFRPDTLEVFNKVIKRPNGIFLVTGPTGSGKTTTLYSALNLLNRPDKKIITAEDPVEYNFKGINQVQINEHIGLKFQLVLKAMLRQAPNIVLVGEIRDKEVADVAVQAALTGHLVFSTLHTNDAPSACTRLIDMGVKPFLVASSIQAVLAQRLVRILCPECKKPDPTPNRRLLKLCGFTNDELVGRTLYQPVGCPKCGSTGYKGRRGIYEMMMMNAELRDLAFKKSPLNQLQAAAVRSGMRTLLGDGKLKILDGNTTADEISKIAQAAGIVDDEEAA